MIKISTQLARIEDRFTIEFCQNGYLLEVSGVDNKDNWKNIRVFCNTTNDINELVEDITTIPVLW